MGTQDDAQREMEQRALRNVRGLVDKVETQELASKQSERRMLRNLVIGGVVVFLCFAAFFGYISRKESGRTISTEQKR